MFPPEKDVKKYRFITGTATRTACVNYFLNIKFVILFGNNYNLQLLKHKGNCYNNYYFYKFCYCYLLLFGFVTII